ncbi:pantothenate kinase [Pyrococcus furiosus DSM 3638]|uniref:Pantoate kinase n=3 Tax=Pyrococcus furiosus TaxID=2261 RepID=Q8TZV8_PYRFU|nr:pantoate kinase [Pyrococcus furiosus]AAL81993.1 hypothetical protein PF1869 [Pyrococcus furiosus DSM 3638]AFN04771.1 hypothetical protein PFC_09240 [Pyrococcus furiosus COM1]QEK79467.1 pantothenate kinase [Pyrococcus furiosus DSM 3638]
MLIRAFVPAHITAFFVPIIRDNPQDSGSLGAGINLEKGTNVFLNIEEGLERHIHVAFNGEPVKKEEAPITMHVANKIVPEDFVGEIEIWQYFDFPTGYGFGNSAGGALGSALVLGYKFGGTVLSLAKIAHEAEVVHKGGLGDVVAQLTGGIEIRIKEGGPGKAIVDNIINHEYKVLAIPIGELRTKEVLDDDVIRTIEKEGRISLQRLLQNPTPEVLMNEARRFAEATGLLSNDLLEIAREIDKVIFLPSSMIMLGKSIFALLRDEEEKKVKEVLKDLDLHYEICRVYWGKPLVERWIPNE